MRLSYEMSFNHSLPIQFNSPHGKRTQYARDLLDHPLSNLNDSRLVTACEMCELREIPFRPHESIASQDQAEVDRLVRMANRGIHELYDYWLGYYRKWLPPAFPQSPTRPLTPERLGLPNDHFLRIELDNQKAYCIMYTNSPAWHSVQKKGDVQRLNPERQAWVAEAMRSGAFLVQCLANKRLEKESEFGNHGYYVGIVATARYLIRMCELLPSACDLQEISLNIDRLLLKLPVCTSEIPSSSPFPSVLSSQLSASLPSTIRSHRLPNRSCSADTSRRRPFCRRPPPHAPQSARTRHTSIYAHLRRCLSTPANRDGSQPPRLSSRGNAVPRL